MRILLLYPPVSIPSQPYLSLPSLTSFLKREGMDVVQRDLNVEFFDEILTGSRLQESYDKIKIEHECLEHLKTLTSEEHEKYITLSEAVITAPFVLDNIGRAMGFLRNPEGYRNHEVYSQSSITVQRALALFSAEYYPADIALTHYRSKYSDCSIDDIRLAVNDGDNNPFYDFYRRMIIPYVDSENFNVIGISIPYFYQVIPGLTLAKLINEKKGDSFIVVGGCAFTEQIDSLMRHDGLFSDVDGYIVYEGETPLLNLVECVETGGGLENVPNLIYRSNGRIGANNLDSYEDVNLLPTPDFDGIPLHLYLSPSPVLPIASSRGCYWGRCTFCSHDTSYHNKYRPRNTDLVLNDLYNLHEKYNAGFFEFVDSTMHPRAAGEIARELKRTDTPIEWYCYAKPDVQYLSDSLMTELSSGGCRMLMMGIESACERIVRLMRKGTDSNSFDRVLSNCHEHHVIASLFFILGFPTETAAEMEETFAFLRKHKKWIDGYFCLFTFGLVKNCEIAKDPERYGVTVSVDGRDDFFRIYDYSVESGLDTRMSQEMQMTLRSRYREIDQYLDRISRLLIWRGHCLFLDKEFFGFSSFRYDSRDWHIRKKELHEKRKPFGSSSYVFTRRCKYDIDAVQERKYVDTADSILQLLHRGQKEEKTEVHPHETDVLYDAVLDTILKAE